MTLTPLALENAATTPLFGETAGAEFSPCRTWRYRLWRQWEPGIVRSLVMLMLNPSTADETVNDPTVERCERRARMQGYGRLEVLNIFAFRATDPDDMKAAIDPVGPHNDFHLASTFAASTLLSKKSAICAGWGIHGSHLGRDRQVQALAERFGVQLMCLGTTKDGQPRHPLYVGYDVPFQPWIIP